MQVVEKTTFKQWEYKTHYSGDINTLNNFGADGWELVCYDGGSYVFKRERRKS